MSQPSYKRKKGHLDDITLMNEFDMKSFANPNTADLFRILNEKEIAYKKLEKSYKEIEKSFNEGDFRN